MKTEDMPLPEFSIGDYIEITGPYAGDWEDAHPIRICGIEWKPDWRKFYYTIIDKDGFRSDGFEVEHFKVRTTNNSEVKE